MADVMPKVAQVRAAVTAPARSRSTSRSTAASTHATAPVAVAAGANVFVAGSAIFGHPRPWEAADAIRAAARAAAAADNR